LTGRSEEEIDLVEAYTRRQGMFRDAETPKADFNNVITLNLDSIVASIAGPKRPQDRIALSDAKHEIRSALTEVRQGKEKESAIISVNGRDEELSDLSVVIAAITSCTNTSNPGLILESSWRRDCLRKMLDVEG